MCHMVEIECRLNLELSTVGLRQLRVCSATILQRLNYVSCATSVVLSLAVCGCGDAVIRCGWLFRCYSPVLLFERAWAVLRAVVITHVDAGRRDHSQGMSPMRCDFLSPQPMPLPCMWTAACSWFRMSSGAGAVRPMWFTYRTAQGMPLLSMWQDSHHSCGMPAPLCSPDPTFTHR